MNHFPHRKTERRGAVTVEFALTAPILLMLVFGAIEFSRANMLYNTVGIAATEGARAGITSGATAAEVRSAAQRELDILGIRESTIAVDPAVITDDTALVAVGIAVPVSARNSYMLPRFFMGKSVNKVVVLQREAATSSSQRTEANSADAIARVTAAIEAPASSGSRSASSGSESSGSESSGTGSASGRSGSGSANSWLNWLRSLFGG